MEGCGRIVVIETAQNVFDLYGGLGAINVKVGQVIKPNSKLGTAGATVHPRQTGFAPHLHLGRIYGSLFNANNKVNKQAAGQCCGSAQMGQLSGPLVEGDRVAEPTPVFPTKNGMGRHPAVQEQIFLGSQILRPLIPQNQLVSCCN